MRKRKKEIEEKQPQTYQFFIIGFQEIESFRDFCYILIVYRRGLVLLSLLSYLLLFFVNFKIGHFYLHLYVTLGMERNHEVRDSQNFNRVQWPCISRVTSIEYHRQTSQLQASQINQLVAEAGLLWGSLLALKMLVTRLYLHRDVGLCAPVAVEESGGKREIKAYSSVNYWRET